MLNGECTHILILQKRDVSYKVRSYAKIIRRILFRFMSFVIEIKFRSEDEVGHHLFIRKHQTRVIDTTRPKNRTILVCNIPPWCPTNQIKRLFSPYGSIVSTEVKTIIFHQKSVNYFFSFN